ncbi:LysE family translocator [Breoghania sp. L-A4]|nr:LysE family translocator [Breoghania sp. L-A4]
MSFIPQITVLAAFTLAAALLIVTPGPDMTLTVGKALTQGRAAGFAAMFGATSGIIVHTLLAAYGLSALLAASETAFLAVKVAGALYLVWLAVQSVRKGSALSLDMKPEPRRGIARVWLQGVAINLLNPKIVLFFVTFLPQFVSSGDPGARGKLVFLGFYFIALSIPAGAAMILTAERFSSALKRSPKVMKTVDWLFAGLMGAFALRIVTAAAK